MDLLSHLPVELLLGLLPCIFPDDLLAFCQISRRVYYIALPFLQEHRELKNQFHIISNRDGQNSYADWLRAFVERPRARLHVKHLIVEQPFSNWQSWGDSDDHVHGIPAGTDVTLLSGVVKQAPFIDSRDIDEWIQETQRGNEAAITAVLLDMLQNVASIKLQGHFTRLDMIISAVSHVVTSNHRPCSSGPLSHLRTVHLDPWLGSASGKPTLTDLAVLAALPALNTMYAAGVTDVDDSTGPFPWPLAPRSSTIVHLKLTCRAIIGEKFSRLIEGTQKLKTLSIKLVSGTLNAGELGRKLLEHASFSLEYLCLITSPVVQREYLGSLDGFLNLRKVSTHFDMLLDSKNCRKRLASVLPASIEHIRLKASTSDFEEQSDIVSDLIDDMKTSPSGLCKLKRLSIEKDESKEKVRYSKLQQGCRSAELNPNGYHHTRHTCSSCNYYCVYSRWLPQTEHPWCDCHSPMVKA